ncbi:uncharacterized protein F5147DRAFT_74570 [Suillus discolor]|uniref:Uncharacterized protein n=1 Tax=Suillus discolor TaxID=1912936 RepID=A0A9P7FDM8_9AGAM|nr:uncharacterized protein F5147DRAFT_74570 [Suillus discolor]KAG2112680.1 hypothetical protein F5147DRAFT_74570 [Suillus discolor]
MVRLSDKSTGVASLTGCACSFRLGVVLSLMTLLTSLACTDSPANILKSAIVLNALYNHTSIVPNIQMPWKYTRDKTWTTHLFSYPRLLYSSLITAPTTRHILDPRFPSLHQHV